MKIVNHLTCGSDDSVSNGYHNGSSLDEQQMRSYKLAT